MLNSWHKFVCVIGVLFLTVSIGVQSSTSRITGTVTDATGSFVEGAKVTLINEATGVSLTQTSL